MRDGLRYGDLPLLVARGVVPRGGFVIEPLVFVHAFDPGPDAASRETCTERPEPRGAFRSRTMRRREDALVGPLLELL